MIREKTDISELYTDGGYYSNEIQQISKDNEVKVNFTDMTGRKANPEKLPLSDFTIEDQKKITACPQVKFLYDPKGTQMASLALPIIVKEQTKQVRSKKKTKGFCSRIMY